MAENSPGPAPVKRRPASLRQEAETIATVKDPVGRLGLRAAFHVRRYSVIYALGVLAAAAVLLMPTVAETGHPGLVAAGPSNNGAATSQANAPTTGSTAGASGSAPATSGGGSTAVASVSSGTGATRAGFQCSPA